MAGRFQSYTWGLPSNSRMFLEDANVSTVRAQLMENFGPTNRTPSFGEVKQAMHEWANANKIDDWTALADVMTVPAVLDESFIKFYRRRIMAKNLDPWDPRNIAQLNVLNQSIPRPQPLGGQNQFTWNGLADRGRFGDNQSVEGMRAMSVYNHKNVFASNDNYRYNNALPYFQNGQVKNFDRNIDESLTLFELESPLIGAYDMSEIYATTGNTSYRTFVDGPPQFRTGV